MGITHFTSVLQPFAVQTQLAGQSVVIDGPGLAYHVHRLWARRRGRGQPSHELLAKSALSWLDELATAGVSIGAIYFDGALPPGKRPVRLARLRKQAAGLEQFHRNNRQGCEADKILLAATAPIGSLFDDAATGGCNRSTPSPVLPSFLVPAVIEALRSSGRYRGLTHVVPEEADVFCADHVRRLGGIVLTGDSDLLVHDLGAIGSAAFFGDVRYSCCRGMPQGGSASTITMMMCERFCPRMICDRLGLEFPRGLWRLAFEVCEKNGNMSPRRAAATAAAICSKPVKNLAAFEEFAAQYQPRDLSGLVLRCPLDWLGGLDPRLSEVLVQGMEDDGLDSSSGAGRALMAYLPSLMDCPARGSAWARSVTIRQLAYTFIQMAHGNRDLSVSSSSLYFLEHGRVQSTSKAGKRIDPVLMPALQEEGVLRIQQAFEQAIVAAPGNDAFLRVYVALYFDVLESREAGANSLCLRMIQSFPRAVPATLEDGDRLLSWDMVHFTALLQACFYSIRMLGQAILFSSIRLGPEAAVPACALRLRPLLERLTPLALTPSVEDIIRVLAGDGTSDLMIELLAKAGMGMMLEAVDKKGSAKEKTQGSEPKLSLGAARRSSNPFEILYS